MKLTYMASFVAAVVCHALLLYGFKLEIAARPLPTSDDASPVEVSLVPAQKQAPAVETPPAPEPTPPPVAPAVEQPAPTPPPMEQPVSTPEPAMTEPVPVATAMPSAPPHPVSQHPKPAPANTAPKPAVSHRGGNRDATPATSNGPHGTTARYRSNPKPDYPAEARRLRQEGLVLLKVEVGTDGRAGQVSLKRSSGFPLLDEAAIRAVKDWTFEPATAGSFPVPSTVEVPVRFNLAE